MIISIAVCLYFHVSAFVLLCHCPTNSHASRSPSLLGALRECERCGQPVDTAADDLLCTEVCEHFAKLIQRRGVLEPGCVVHFDRSRLSPLVLGACHHSRQLHDGCYFCQRYAGFLALDASGAVEFTAAALEFTSCALASRFAGEVLRDYALRSASP